MKFSFIGLGQMGKPIALNLLKNESDFIACDINEDVLTDIKDKGIKTTISDNEAADADIIFLCLPDTYVVEEVLISKNGIIDLLKEGQIIVDFSTISYLSAVKIADILEKKGVEFLDAPISGRKSRAEEGTLAIMCGGKEEIYNKVKPYMDYMGNQIVYMGKSGNGQLSKMINNCIYDINIAGIAEMLPFAVKLGLDPEKIGQVINNGTGRSNASEFFIPNMLERNFSYGFTMNKAYKDLVSAAEVSSKMSIPLPVLNAATLTYQMALLKGYGDDYKGAMIQVYEELLGVKYEKKND